LGILAAEFAWGLRLLRMVREQMQNSANKRKNNNQKDKKEKTI